MNEASVQDLVEKADGSALCLAMAGCLKVEDKIDVWRQTTKLLEEALVVAKLHLTSEEKAIALANMPEDNLLMTLPKTLCIMPKGKLDIDFGENKLVVKGKDFVVTTTYSNVDAMLKLPRNDPVAKATVISYEFVLRLKEPVAHRKAMIKYIAFEVKATSAITPDENMIFHLEPLQEDPLLEDKRLHQAVEMFLVKLVPSHFMIKTFPEVSGSRYVSTHGGSFVKCYRKTTSGLLYFLPEGLCFLNPPLFLSRKEIETFSWGRETGLHLRTFDLTVQLTDAPKIEFSMLEKEEIPSITEFAATFAALKTNDERNEQNDGTVPTTVEDDSDADDSDYIMEESENASDEDYDELSGSAYSDSGSENDNELNVTMVDSDEEGPLGPFPQVDMEDI
ncbi:hypothetical protein THRCLA_11552 [Thraustotheca clavata]|uniref:FACT complex subunit SSRP1 n=1 Tax=Thraustotheca clavata TaxID=74557 RepID=A0A1V9Y7B9_9STRA|nr:hypothetical protein THRCLA_11552 [Thraustotheca clavata]